MADWDRGLLPGSLPGPDAVVGNVAFAPMPRCLAAAGLEKDRCLA
jgi:hypothetical protein